MLAGLCFQTPTSEIIRTWRYEYPWRNFKRHKQSLAMRVPVELEAVARFEPQVDRSHKVRPGLYDSFRVRIAHVIILEEFLAYPAERTNFRRTRLEVATGGRALHAGSRQETDQWLKS